VLNVLLIIPHFLISIRNSLLPNPPTVGQQSRPSQHPLGPLPSPAATVPVAADGIKLAEELSEHEGDVSETGSEADAESNSSGHDGVGSSWIKA
jgi:hypothetical protein